MAVRTNCIIIFKFNNLPENHGMSIFIALICEILFVCIVMIAHNLKREL